MTKRVPLYLRAPFSGVHELCPFCGNAPQAVKTKGVRCITRKCGIYLRMFTAEKWNTRAGKPANLTLSQSFDGTQHQ